MKTEKLSTRQILENNLAREAPEEMKSMKIMLHNLRSMHNVGSAFRSADAFGISEILLSGITPHPPRPEISKTAIGAEKYVEWSHYENFKKHIDQLKTDDYQLIGLEQTDRSIHLTKFEPTSDRPICLVYGNEVTGIDDEILPYIDTFVDIPQYGHKHSLNVSVSIGVSLYGFLERFWD